MEVGDPSSSGAATRDPVEIHAMCTYLDARDPSMLDWITESQIPLRQINVVADLLH